MPLALLDGVMIHDGSSLTIKQMRGQGKQTKKNELAPSAT